MKNKVYVGDSVYLEVKSIFEIILTTENGYGPTNTIILDLELLNLIKTLTDKQLGRSERED